MEHLVAEYEANGLGRQAFCDAHGLSLSTLNRHWKRQQARNRPAADDGWVAVELCDAPQTPEVVSCNELVVALSVMPG